MKPLIEVAEFNEGYRYAEFNSKTDRMAEYGLGALIAGGVAAKLGLFAKLGVMLLGVQEVHHRGSGGHRRIHRQAVRQEEGRCHLSDGPARFRVRIEPGGHELLVSAGENVLAAALAAGLPLPHSCRAGRCASCKARLLAGQIAYPQGTLPPGITADEAARGEVLLCQARARSDLSIETRRSPTRSVEWQAQLIAIDELPLGALRLRMHFVGSAPATRPGQFMDLRNASGDAERLAVIGVRDAELDLEAPQDGSRLREWLDSGPLAGVSLWLEGPFDRRAEAQGANRANAEACPGAGGAVRIGRRGRRSA